MEIFLEKNIVNNNIDKHSKRSTVLKVLRIASIVLLVLACLFIFLFLQIPQNAGQILPFILTIIMIIAPFIAAIIIFKKLLNNTNLEFDYFIINDLLRIVQIQRRTKRKLFLEANMSSFTSVGCVDSENFERYSNDKEVKKIYALCNEDSENLIYIYFNYKQRKTLLIMEVDSEFIMTMRKAIRRMDIFDSSLKKITNNTEDTNNKL